jgi:hypothetical protein
LSNIRAGAISGINGTDPVTLTKQSAAKAWVSFQGTGTVSIKDSFNVSSISDIGTGNYRAYYTSNMEDADYCILTAGASLTAGSGSGGKNISSYTEYNLVNSAGISNFNASGSGYEDVSRVFVHVTGDLA